MSTIKLQDGFKLMPVGRHVFEVRSVEYSDDFGIATVKLRETEGAGVMTQRFTIHLADADDSADGCNTPGPGLGLFSSMVRAIKRAPKLKDFDTDDMDELVGGRFEAEVYHSKSKKNPDMTFANLRSFKEAPASEDDAEDVDMDGIL